MIFGYIEKGPDEKVGLILIFMMSQPVWQHIITIHIITQYLKK